MSQKNFWIPIGTAVAGLAIGIGGTYVVSSNAAASTPTPTVTATVTATATAAATGALDIGRVISQYNDQVAPRTVLGEKLTSSITCPFQLTEPAGTVYACTITYSDGKNSGFKFTVKDGKASIEGLK